MASIIKATVTSVNTAKFTVDALGDLDQKEHFGVPVAGMYMHPEHGAGVYHLPEVGAKCYIFMIKEGSGEGDQEKFVLGFQMDETPDKDDNEAVSDDDFLASYGGEREPLEPGDIFLGTADDNRVILRKGGIVQIGATGLSQRVYIPVENMVRDYFQRYHAISPLGEIEWGHATLVSGENPANGAGSLANSDYFIDDADSNKLSFTQETPVLVKYNIKDLCQEDVTGGKYTVEVRMGRLTTDTLDVEEDVEHIFAQEKYKNDTYRRDLPVRPNLTVAEDSEDSSMMGVEVEEKGVVSFTIYSHDDGENKDKVTYAFQLNRDGDNFIFSRGSVHVEIAETVYANIQKGARISYGDKGVAGSQSVVELLQSNELRTSIKALIHEVINDMEVDATNIKLNATGNVILGEGADDFVVRLNALETFLTTTFQCVTAFGPSGPMITPFDPSVGSTTVKVKS